MRLWKVSGGRGKGGGNENERNWKKEIGIEIEGIERTEKTMTKMSRKFAGAF